MKRLIVILLTAVLAFGFTVNASAVGEPMDLNKEGSVAVTFRCAHGYNGNGTATLFRVANAVWSEEDDSYSFVFTEEFKDCGLSLDNITDDLDANNFKKYAKEQNIQGDRQTIKNGAVVFEDLPLGLYLIIHEDSAGGFSDALPFFVTVPVGDGDVWDYSVDASPKIEVEHIELSEPPSIPQTGQLKWPVPVLAFSGVLVFAFGWVLCFRRSKEK